MCWTLLPSAGHSRKMFHCAGKERLKFYWAKVIELSLLCQDMIIHLTFKVLPCFLEFNSVSLLCHIKALPPPDALFPSQGWPCQHLRHPVGISVSIPGKPEKT